MTALVVKAPSALAELAPLVERARTYATASKSSNTRRAYASRWRRFQAWCGEHSLTPLPAGPESVALFLSELADGGAKAATIELSLVAISQAHTLAGHPSPRASPLVQAVRQGIRRTIGTAQAGKAPLLAAALRVALEGAPSGMHALRDRAVLLVGWSGAFRRSELVALQVTDVRHVPEGLELHLQRSKTDQVGAGRLVAIPRSEALELCPAEAVRAWCEAAHLVDGPLFRSIDRWGRLGPSLSAQTVARLVKSAAAAAGLDAADFAGHSLRSGLVTEAARAGRGEAAIMRVTGHQSAQMVRRYIKESDAWRDAPGRGLLDGDIG